ncbi:hypothetical protein RISK_005227 [Rhodopirellula islandica]|uniref:Uncharacterized protein n=1 Tax=Rhodopirellula islandica TaxID=595434 RepID=A0A0J1B907_RHOIS|nr:hypothetical protein RISK_005227 [Rhodopirellula islandica]
MNVAGFAKNSDAWAHHHNPNALARDHADQRVGLRQVAGFAKNSDIHQLEHLNSGESSYSRIPR